jgi:hypothetical protein
MDLKGLKARGNWSRICSKRDLARVRTHKLPMALLWLVVFCIFPSANYAQVPVYEVTPVESTSSLATTLRRLLRVPSTNGPQA